MTRISSNTGVVVAALRNCTTELEVKQFFESFGINDTESKRKFIWKAMGDAEVFYNGEPTDEDKLECEIAMLIDGEWRADELYQVPQG